MSDRLEDNINHLVNNFLDALEGLEEDGMDMGDVIKDGNILSFAVETGSYETEEIAELAKPELVEAFAEFATSWQGLYLTHSNEVPAHVFALQVIAAFETSSRPIARRLIQSAENQQDKGPISSI